MKNADMPAMPCTKAMGEIFEGLSKREMFAMNLMSAIISNQAFSYKGWAGAASMAVESADALLEELDR